MKIGIGIDISFNNNAVFKSPYYLINQFERRVIQEGATLEAQYCLYSDLEQLTNNRSKNESLAYTLQYRVKKTGALFESQNCLTNILNTIQ
mgnify:CR=1 FL=1